MKRKNGDPVWRKLGGAPSGNAWQVTYKGRTVTLRTDVTGKTTVEHPETDKVLFEGKAWGDAKAWAMKWLLESGIIERHDRDLKIYCACGRTFQANALDPEVRCKFCNLVFKV